MRPTPQRGGRPPTAAVVLRTALAPRRRLGRVLGRRVVSAREGSSNSGPRPLLGRIAVAASSARRRAASSAPEASRRASPSQAGRSRSTSVTAVASRGRRSGVRSRSRLRRRAPSRGRRRPGSAARARAPRARARPRRSARPRRATRRRSPTGCRSSPPRALDVGLVEQPPDEQQHGPAAGEHDRDAVAARQVEALLLRARPDEEQHGDGDEQDRGLDEREDPERRARWPGRPCRPAKNVFWYQGSTSESASASAAARGQLQLLRQSREIARARLIGSGCPPPRARARGGLSRRSIEKSSTARSASSSSRSASASWRASSGGSVPRSAVDEREQRAESGNARRRRPAPLPSRWAASRPPRRARPPRPRVRLAHQPLGRLVGLAVGLSHARTPRAASPPRASPTSACSRPARPAARSCACGRRRGRSARARSSSARRRPCSANGRSSRSDARAVVDAQLLGEPVVQHAPPGRASANSAPASWSSRSRADHLGREVRRLQHRHGRERRRRPASSCSRWTACQAPK